MTSDTQVAHSLQIEPGRSIITRPDGHETVRYRHFSRVERAPYRLLEGAAEGATQIRVR